MFVYVCIWECLGNRVTPEDRPRWRWDVLRWAALALGCAGAGLELGCAGAELCVIPFLR